VKDVEFWGPKEIAGCWFGAIVGAGIIWIVVGSVVWRLLH